jgi:hypothetical protein
VVERYTQAMATPKEDRDRKARAAARRSWPVRVYRLGEEPDDDLSTSTTAAERIEMMWPLALDAWSSAGLPIPDYPRNEAPIRVIRPADSSRAKGEPR